MASVVLTGISIMMVFRRLMMIMIMNGVSGNGEGFGKMTEITAYHNPTAPVYRQWIAYIVLSDGKLWGVYAIGATEEAAKAKISILWESERAKVIVGDPWANVNQPRANECNTQHHRAGKIWMRHKETRELVSIPLTEITMYEGRGYERSGPRSK